MDTLNRQINALRVQLATLEQALDLEQQKVEEQQVTITDLGSKLNMALAGKVEELSRFRSEFFGRLQRADRRAADVRVVGDRFVFQSEVLFPTASADIDPGGVDELRKLADSLRAIASEIPSDLPWILQINGHTDRRPIRRPSSPRTGNCPRRVPSTWANSWFSRASPPSGSLWRVRTVPAD